jgi:endonuclease/exonuclease/phosphatase family metal-dependent hydrolase
VNDPREWLKNLSDFQTLSRLRESDFFAENGREIETFLRTPQIYCHDGASPRLESFCRIAQWNIEKGKRFDAVLDRFQNDPALKWADIIVLNEADYGMNRSRNRHVARELAERLGMHMAFGPAHFELTRGTREDLDMEGSNRESLQGNAVLSRHPVLKTCVIPLPVTFEPYEFEEKRFGGRSCLWAQLRIRKSLLWVGSVHLELRNTPRCRARQMGHIMQNLPGGDDEAFLLGGDLNTNSFRRGTAWRAFGSVARILWHKPARVKEQLLHPEKRREPLFDVLDREGFFWDTLNSGEETARTAIDTLEESDFLPRFLSRGIKKRLKPYNGYLCFKLDWFLGRNLRALSRGEKRDIAGGPSLDPGCVPGENSGPERISDHLPIYVDLDF